MGEYEPDDSRNVTGAARTPDARWGDAKATKQPADKNRQQSDRSEPPGVSGVATGEPTPEGVPDGAPFTAEEAASRPPASELNPDPAPGIKVPRDQKYPAGS